MHFSRPRLLWLPDNSSHRWRVSGGLALRILRQKDRQLSRGHSYRPTRTIINACRDQLGMSAKTAIKIHFKVRRLDNSLLLLLMMARSGRLRFFSCCRLSCRRDKKPVSWSRSHESCKGCRCCDDHVWWRLCYIDYHRLCYCRFQITLCQVHSYRYFSSQNSSSSARSKMLGSSGYSLNYQHHLSSKFTSLASNSATNQF